MHNRIYTFITEIWYANIINYHLHAFMSADFLSSLKYTIEERYTPMSIFFYIKINFQIFSFHSFYIFDLKKNDMNVVMNENTRKWKFVWFLIHQKPAVGVSLKNYLSEMYRAFILNIRSFQMVYRSAGIFLRKLIWFRLERLEHFNNRKMSIKKWKCEKFEENQGIPFRSIWTYLKRKNLSDWQIQSITCLAACRFCT